MLDVLINSGIGATMANAIKQLYSSTKIFYNSTGQFETTKGIRQGASSSAYIFIIFVNKLFNHLRNSFQPNEISGNIHNLIHADDTIIIDTDKVTFKEKVIASHKFFSELHQN